MEIWKDIKGYEGIYQVSNLGRVRSLDRIIKRSDNGLRKYKGRILKGRPNKGGYLNVLLSLNGVGNNCRVHRLVAQAFLENPAGKPQVNHMDGNKINNQVENLEWVTNSENQKHAFANGLQTRKKGSEHMQSVQVVQICTGTDRIIYLYGSINEASRSTGVAHSNIIKCCKGQIKKSGGFKWRYVS